jgi:hypothetical protein
MSDEDPDIDIPERGTASRGSPIIGSAPVDEDEQTITIKDPDGGIRTYDLNENVKEAMQGPIESCLDRIADWYEIWWEGTEMVIEFQGKVRKPSAQSTGTAQQRDKQDELPRHPEIPWMPREEIPQAIIDIDEMIENSDDDFSDVKSFNKGLLPVHDFERIDVQNRAEKNPLEFEDVLIMIDEEPVESSSADEEMELDIDDIRDMTDEKDTVRDGARGNRYNL